MYTFSLSLKRIKAILIVFVLSLVCYPFNVQAQPPTTAAAYPFIATTGTFTYLSGGNPISQPPLSIYLYPSYTSLSNDDVYAQNIPIGFSFPFCTGTYTQLSACSNGFIYLDNTGTTNLTNSASGITGPILMPLWEDLSGAQGTASYLTTGSSPNRVFTFEWKNWLWNYTGSSPAISYQVKLYESGLIEFWYKNEGGTIVTSSGGATIGIARNSSDYKTLNNSSSSPTPSSSTFTDNILTSPATGQVYIWGQLPCTGVPTTSVVGPNLACPGKSFTLGLSGLSQYSGLTYQWQQSSNGTSWSNFTGPGATTNSITDVVTTAPRWYRCIVTCTNSSQSYTTQAFMVSVAPFYYCYCEGSKATSATGTDVGNVTVVSYPHSDTLLNNGSATPFLSNSNSNKTYSEYRYTVPPVPMYHDSSYLLFMKQILSTSSFTAATGVIYIDYNRNGRFDPWEKILEDITTQTLPDPGMIRDTFLVPDSAGYGLTGMRVIMRSGSTAPDTCSSYTDGETEDYLVDLRYSPCDGKPQAGTIEGDTSMCVGYEYTLTDTSYEHFVHGIDHQWQISADAINWTNIAGTATQDNLTRTFTGQPLYYRVRFICTHTNDTSFSAVHKVNLKPTYKCYCFSQSTGQQLDTADIGGFSISTFSVTDGGAHLGNPRAVRARQDYTDMAPIEMMVDSIYEIHVFHTQPNEFHSDGKVTIFMDFNNDHKYNIPEERVYTGFTNVGYHTIIHDITIPDAAIVDVPTGMRVIINNNVAPNTPSDEACGTYTSGETEDYMVMFRRPFNVGVSSPDNNIESVRLYPNPTNDGKFNISFRSAAAKEVRITVTTATGQKVSEQSYSHTGGRFTQQLDLGTAAKGVYFVEVNADGIKAINRVVVR